MVRACNGEKEMREMTEEELLNSTLKELGFEVKYIDNLEGYYVYGHRIEFCTKDIGITLKKPQPEITIKNLGRFMAKHGKYPKADFLLPDGSYFHSTLVSINLNNSKMYESPTSYFADCTITDPLWAELEE